MADWDPSFSDGKRSPSPNEGDKDNEKPPKAVKQPSPRRSWTPCVTAIELPNPRFPQIGSIHPDPFDQENYEPYKQFRRPPIPHAALCHYFISDDASNMTSVEHFAPNHRDRVTALDVNFDATLILTGSLDHRIKIFSHDPKSGEKTLVETFTAHDAYIRAAKWLHSTNGNVLATIGDDRRLRFWKENLTQLPNSGHRYQRIAEIWSPSTVPFVSLDLITVDSVFNYMAAVDRRGLVSIYEPTNTDDLREWTLLDQWNVGHPPIPGEESSFKVRFDPNLSSVAYIHNMTDGRSLGLAVTALDEVVVYRSMSTDDEPGPPPPARFRFYLIAALPKHPKLVRDVQWAPFNVRGFDLLATACRDGTVQIFEMHTTPSTEPERTTRVAPPTTRPVPPRPQPRSSLTTAIAGRAPEPATVADRVSEPRNNHHFPQQYQIECVAKIDAHQDAWSLAWDPTGQVLMSVGSEGSTKLWKKSIVQGEWKLFADQAFTRDE